MAEFERDDIRKGPIYPWIVFGGDGNFAQVIRMYEGFNSEGESVWKMQIIPTEELAKIYNIPLESLDSNGSIKVEYPVNMIVQLSRDPSNPFYFCYLNFLGHQTATTASLLGYPEKEKIIGIKRMLDIKEAECFYWREKAEIATCNTSEFIKKYIQEPAGELSAQLIAQQTQGLVQPSINQPRV